MATVTEPYPGYVTDLEQAVGSLRDVLKNQLDIDYWSEVGASIADYVTDPREGAALRTAIGRALEHE